MDKYIDLHLHLDGSISVENAICLANIQGIQIPTDKDKIKSLLIAGEDCRNLNQFLEKFDFPCSLLQSKDGLEMATYNLLCELAADGLMYAEIRFAPQKSCDKKLTQEQAVRAVLSGMERAEAEGVIYSNLILCCMRGENLTKENLETIEVAAKLINKGKYLGAKVSAVDLAGAEGLFPTSDYADIFAAARSRKIPITIHAGEADGPDSIRSAVDFGAVRIGHGVRCTEDADLMREIADKGIVLELCPTSNLNTCIYSSITEYPIRRLMEAGIKVTVNTDDMSVCGTNLPNEIKKLSDAFLLSKEEIKGFILNSIESSFAGEPLKKILFEKFNDIN